MRLLCNCVRDIYPAAFWLVCLIPLALPACENTSSFCRLSSPFPATTQLCPLLQTAQVNVHSLGHNSPKYFQCFETAGYHCRALFFYSFFICDSICITLLPMVKTKSARWNVMVVNKGKDCLVFESSPSFSFNCKEVQSNKNKIKNR